jgi:hypothetical protein
MTYIHNIAIINRTKTDKYIFETPDQEMVPSSGRRIAAASKMQPSFILRHEAL